MSDDIKLTVYVKGVPRNVNINTLPVDSIGRPYEYIVDEIDEFGKYRRDEEYYKQKEIEDRKAVINKLSSNTLAELNSEYTEAERELFPILENEANNYILSEQTPTPVMNMFLQKEIVKNKDNKNYIYSKHAFAKKIINKARKRREVLLSVVSDIIDIRNT